MGQGVTVSNLCLVVRGVDAWDRPILCLQEATVEVSARLMRKREVCARCANEIHDLRSYDFVKMRLLPSAMGILLR
jgi:hypothetical protein